MYRYYTFESKKSHFVISLQKIKIATHKRVYKIAFYKPNK